MKMQERKCRMANTTVNPTRMELTRLKKKLITARRGHKLLKDKRDELMRQFLELVRQNKSLREKVEIGIKKANGNFALARSAMSDEAVRVAFMAPRQEVSLDISYRNVMSVNVPQYKWQTRTSDANDIYSYGFAFTSSDLDDAVKGLSDLLPDMMKLSGERKELSAHGVGNRKDQKKSERSGACPHSGHGAEHQVHHDEAGRERTQFPDQADEGEGHDA
jgi:H(+)-transporting ATP synthase subunit D